MYDQRMTESQAEIDAADAMDELYDRAQLAVEAEYSELLTRRINNLLFAYVADICDDLGIDYLGFIKEQLAKVDSGDESHIYSVLVLNQTYDQGAVKCVVDTILDSSTSLSAKVSALVEKVLRGDAEL